ncbi:hypothetical protein EHQ52_13100 [Leptospira koniambonensis]|uniref:Uncharacterized protein n=1 Tax=Leptospira koniambonensis TaxID=2484950 RepID=A0A4R9JAA5_9LEPT|nr:hypothetical protein [Leptospira koniambonensis]TGL35395.1 hypothetical protein EHQ52_13100 [Leptospira koniambonensis]
MNRIYKLLFITFLLIIISYNCKKEKPEGDPEYQKKVEEARNYLKAHIKESYDISETSPTRDAAVSNYLDAVNRGETDKYLCTKQEYLDVFLPNTLEESTLTSNMPLEQAWEITELRRKVALEQLQDVLKKEKNKPIKIETLTWRDQVRQLNVLKGHRVGNLVIRVGNRSISLEQIRLVIEHKGKFKLCVIGA